MLGIYANEKQALDEWLWDIESTSARDGFSIC